MRTDTAFQERKTTAGSTGYPEWGTARNSIYPLMVSPEHALYHEGKEYLEYSRFLDLLVFYCVRVRDKEGRTARTLMAGSQALEEWGISRTEMEAAAGANLKKDGYWIGSVQSLLQSFMG